MGNNASSTKAKRRQKSESIEIRPQPPVIADSFTKSKSMNDLGTKSKGGNAGSGGKRSNDSIRERDQSKIASKDSTKSNASSIGLSRSKSLRKDQSHPLTAQQREIVVQCFENPHSEFGNKVLQRVYEKRPDYQGYVQTMGKEKAFQMSVRLKELVEDIISKIYDPDYISEVAHAYGEEHVEYKAFGFKPDFWVSIADAITTEGVILDMANHQPADTVGAWSNLVGLMFTAVRDGYYRALRKQRMSSRKGIKRQNTIDSANDQGDTVSLSATTATTPSEHSPSAPQERPAPIQRVTSVTFAPTIKENVNIMAPLRSCSVYVNSTPIERGKPIFQ